MTKLFYITKHAQRYCTSNTTKLPFVSGVLSSHQHRYKSSTNTDKAKKEKEDKQQNITTTTTTTAPRRQRRNDAKGIYETFAQISTPKNEQDDDVPKLLIHHPVDTTSTTTWNPLNSTSTTQNNQPQQRYHPPPSSSYTKPPEYTSRHYKKPLPTLDVSPYLDATHYITKKSLGRKGGVITNNGTDGARRLLKGRQSVNAIIHSLLPHKKPFVLGGHGVPQALLEDHLLLAQQLLSEYGDASTEECSFMNTFDWMLVRDFKSDYSSFNTIPWPPKQFRHEERSEKLVDVVHRLDLYMAVMNRIASNLGAVIIQDDLCSNHARREDEVEEKRNERNQSSSPEDTKQSSSSNPNQDSTTLLTDLAKDAPQPPPSSQPSPALTSQYATFVSPIIKHWRIFFTKGQTFPSQIITPAANAAAADPSSHTRNGRISFSSPPIIEMTQMPKTSHSDSDDDDDNVVTTSLYAAHVRITVQGIIPGHTRQEKEEEDHSSRGGLFGRFGSIDEVEERRYMGNTRGDEAVTVIFDACF
mmetsp:Transcript_18656/g.27002  ORF Transcript_18656/g.27002 Transcript_18656/m.27002 type:complete len:527 (+) Transcript_18656:97-1677(+)